MVVVVDVVVLWLRVVLCCVGVVLWLCCVCVVLFLCVALSCVGVVMVVS